MYPTTQTPAATQNIGVDPGLSTIPNFANNPQLQSAYGNYQSAAGTANASQSQDISLPDLLRNTLAQKFGEGNPLIGARESALKNYLGAKSSAEASVLPENNNGIIFTPSQQASIISGKESAAMAPLATSNYLLGLESGGITNMVDTLAKAHQADTQQLLQKADLAKQNYQQVLDTLSKQAEVAMAARDYSEKIREFNLDQALKQQQLGLQYGTIGPLKDLSDQLQGGQTGQKPAQITDPIQERKLFQQKAAATPDAAVQGQINQLWQSRHPGIPLNPTPLNGDESKGLTDANNTLGLINEAEAILKKNPGITGGATGFLKNIAIPHAVVRSHVSSDEQRLYDIFTSLSTAGQRILIGGRDTGYLFNKLNPAFPDFSKNVPTILAELTPMKKALLGDMSMTAKSHGYFNPSELPGFKLNKPDINTLK